MTGAKLATVPGSVCSNCYAMKGYYKTFAHVVSPAQQRRLASISDPKWIEAMVALLAKERWFRWCHRWGIRLCNSLANIINSWDINSYR
jgi:hypothetical protein